MIKAGSNIGAGFVVAASPRQIHIATAYHVIEGESTVAVTFANPRGLKVEAAVRDFHDRALDLGILVVTTPADLDISTLGGAGAAHSKTTMDGAEVFPMGYPSQKEWHVSQIASFVSDDSDPTSVTIESMTVEPGNSGGPLLDRCGRIVGMVISERTKDARAVRIEHVLQSVERRWKVQPTLKLSDAPCDPARTTTLSEPAPPPDRPREGAGASTDDSKDVIYAVSQKDDLLWYRHVGRDNGTPDWATEGKTIGNSWVFQHLFSGGDGIIYAVRPNGELLWYRHDGRRDGSMKWASWDPKVVGTGWNVRHVFSGGDGVIYSVLPTGELLWNRHDGRGDGTFRWASPESKPVGTGWIFRHVFSGGGGVIYAVRPNGELLWYRHDGYRDGSVKWTDPKVVGVGWDVQHVFSAGGGVIYAVMPNGVLMWNRHEGRADGSFRWAADTGRNVGTGWVFKHVFSGASLVN
jgi:hypothetical protein